jgi:p70 ribosomal S6 kinase
MGIEDFDILKLLGKGAYGKVYLVRRKRTKDLYALKHIELNHSEENNQF